MISSLTDFSSPQDKIKLSLVLIVVYVYVHMHTELLTLGAADIALDNSLLQGVPVDCRVFSSIAVIYPFDASSTFYL